MTYVRAITLLSMFIVLTACQGDDRAQGVHVIHSPDSYGVFVKRLKTAITASGFTISDGACGKCSIRTIDVPEKDTEIISVYQPDLALHMMQAGAAAGGDVPLRFYVTKLDDGTARLTYQQPSTSLMVFNAPKLKPIAENLDKVFAEIIEQVN